MRLRLGLLQDPAVIEKQIAREAAEAQAKKAKAEIPTVKTEAQMKSDEMAATKEKERGADKAKHSSKPRIRPLTEAKAIDTGANFISETFIFSVGLALILVERLYSRRKEQSRQSDVSDRIKELEAADQERNEKLLELNRELVELKAKGGSHWFWQKGQDSRTGSAQDRSSSSTTASPPRESSHSERFIAEPSLPASVQKPSELLSADGKLHAVPTNS